MSVPAGQIAIAQRLDRLPVTALPIAILAVCTIGLSADIAAWLCFASPAPPD